VLPKTRAQFWLAKLNGNVERDVRNEAALRELGWKVLTIWECEVEDEARLLRKIRKSIVKGGCA
jgi:DNA mismatch endonuclease (patch repair protein)